MSNFNLKSALLTSLGFYIANSIVAFVVGFFSIGNSIQGGLTNTTWIIGIISAVVIMYYFAVKFFDKVENRASATDGLLLGITVVVVSSLIDLIGIQFIYHSTIGNYYSDFRYWLMAMLTIGVATLVGANSKRV